MKTGLVNYRITPSMDDGGVIVRRARFGDFLSPDEFAELAGNYPRATVDLNRLNRRVTRRGRVHLDAEQF